MAWLRAGLLQNQDLRRRGAMAERQRAVHPHGDEQEREVEQGVAVHPPGHRRHRPLAPEPDAVPEQPGAEQRGGHAVERPERAEERGQDGEREQDQRVDQHLELGPRLAPHHRHHRHPGPGVVRLLDERQGPEVRRGPVEDDGEQVDGREIDAAGHRGPAHQRRERARRPADDDVLRTRALEPDGIDEDVEQQAATARARR